MPIGSGSIGDFLLTQGLILLVFKIGFVIFAAVYFIFSLIVVRQVNLMTDTLITEVAAFIRIFAVIFAILSLLILIYFIIQL